MINHITVDWQLQFLCCLLSRLFSIASIRTQVIKLISQLALDLTTDNIQLTKLTFIWLNPTLLLFLLTIIDSARPKCAPWLQCLNELHQALEMIEDNTEGALSRVWSGLASSHSLWECCRWCVFDVWFHSHNLFLLTEGGVTKLAIQTAN